MKDEIGNLFILPTSSFRRGVGEMATAGVTHDVVLGGVGYMLAQPKSGSNYVRESLPGYVMPSAAIQTNETESLDSPDGYGMGALPLRRLYLDEWRGVGQPFLRNGVGGKAGLSGARGLVQELVNLRPLMHGAGLGVAPFEVSIATGGTESDFCAIEYKGALYVVQGTAIYIASVDASGNFTGLTATGGAVGAGAKSAGFSADGSAWVCFGSIPRLIDNPAVSYPVAGPTDFMCAYKGVTIRAYTAPNSHGLIYIDLSTTNIHSYGFNSPIRALTVHEGAVWIGCDDGLYRLEGDLRASSSAAPNTLDQFEYRVQQVMAHNSANQSSLGLKNWRGLTSFDGALWGAVDGRLVRLNVHGAGFSFPVEEQPVTGGWVWSMVVAAGMLFVAVQSALENTISSSIWAYDPKVAGWWLLTGGPVNCTYLFSGGAVVRNGALMACHDQEAMVTTWGFDATNPSGLHPYNFRTAGDEQWNWDSAWLTLPFLTPDDLAKEAEFSAGKQGLVKLLKVGVEWDTVRAIEGWRGWPDLIVQAGAGNLNFSCQVSLDEGNSWLHLANAMSVQNYYLTTGNAFAGRTDWQLPEAAQIIKPVAQIGQGAPAETDQNGNGWLIRLNFEGMPSPLIRRVWLNYQVLEFNPQIGNRWKLALDLSCSPEALRLDGQPQDVPTPVNFFGNVYTEGDALAFNLISAWSSGTTLEFADVNGQSGHYVKVISYRLERAAPGRFPALASNGGTLQQKWVMWVELVEVIE